MYGACMVYVWCMYGVCMVHFWILYGANCLLCTGLSQELTNMKVVDFLYPTSCLNVFDSKFEKFNKISLDKMPPSLSVSFLKLMTHGNKELLSAWTSCETITEPMNPNKTPTYNIWITDGPCTEVRGQHH